MPYVPNSDDDRRAMLSRIGVERVEDLLTDIPDKLRMQRPLDIPAIPEMELLDQMRELSETNSTGLACFTAAATAEGMKWS